jgi:hypothetical protein
VLNNFLNDNLNNNLNNNLNKNNNKNNKKLIKNKFDPEAEKIQIEYLKLLSLKEKEESNNFEILSPLELNYEEDLSYEDEVGSDYNYSTDEEENIENNEKFKPFFGSNNENLFYNN